MKTSNRWIVPLTVLSLAGADLAPAQQGKGEKGQQGQRQQQPQVRPTPQPQVRPTPQPQARPTPQPQVRPTPQPQPQPRPAPRPVPQPLPQQREIPQRPTIKPAPAPKPAVPEQPKTRPVPDKPTEGVRPQKPERPGQIDRDKDGDGTPDVPKNRPNVKPVPDVTRNPDGTPGKNPNPNPMIRPGKGNAGPETTTGPQGGSGKAAELARRQQELRKNRVGPNGEKLSPRPMIQRPEEKFRPDAVAARVKPAWQNKWGNWGKWDRNPQARVANLALINRNYQRSLNWSYRPTYWGARPWWTASACHNWHHGSWNYGWNPYWHRHYSWYYPRPYPGYTVGYSRPICWGLVAWGLGSLVYDCGYYSYWNPYLPPAYVYADTVIRYDRPISVVASDYPTGDEEKSTLAATLSAESLERSRSAFKREDYLAALKDVDESISHQPGDSALHEYRALVLFALGKYDEAAGVLNPVLASGPGWDRETMVGLYRTEDAYTNQLARLENYVEGTPDRAAPRFLLGYHYLVAGDMEKARNEFDEVVQIQPKDGIARQLRDLAKNSVKSSEEDEEKTEATPQDTKEDPAVEALTGEQLVGSWTSNRGENGTVVLNLRGDGSFSWTFTKGDQKNDLTGTYEIDDRGLLVLTSEDSQMVGKVALPSDKKMTFILAGGPEGDPGLTFEQIP